jgi:hypothetical protein
MCHHFAKEKKLQKKKYPVFLICFTSIHFVDTNDTTIASSSTLQVPGNGKRSNNPNSTIVTLTSLPTAPLLTTDYLNSIKTELSKTNKKYIKHFHFYF